MRAPSSLLGAGAWDARAAPDPAWVPGGAGIGLVASRSCARPGDARVVGQTRGTRGPRGGLHRDHRSSRIAERDRGIVDRHRRRLHRGGRARVDVLRRHRSSRRRRCPSRPGGERSVPARVRTREPAEQARHGRDPRRVHVPRRHARGGRRAGRDPRRRRARPRRRGSRRRRCRRSASPSCRPTTGC